MEEQNESYKLLQEKYPFLSLGEFRDQQIMGVVQNQNKNFISLYVYSEIRQPEEKKQFLRAAENWWWQSNRTIPIDIFTGPSFRKFRYILKTYNLKEFKLLFGPVVSASKIIQKRIKRKQIQLIKDFSSGQSGSSA